MGRLCFQAANAFLLGLASAASAQTAAGADDAAARAWVQALHEWALPRYERFTAQAEDLTAGLDEACQAGASAGRAAQLRRQWRVLTRTWRELEALQLGPTLQRRTSRNIDFWPTRPAVIEQAAGMTAGAPLEGAEAEDAMFRWGTASKGLPALEWLLFPEAGNAPPLWKSPAMCLYARRLGRGVAGEGAALLRAWQAQSGRWADAPEADVRRAVHEALNVMVGSCELLRGKKLQKGVQVRLLGGPEAGVPFAFDSVRSGQTRDFLAAHFEALAQLLTGRPEGRTDTRDGPAIGLDDMLAAQGRQALGAPLAGAVARARRALRALPEDPRQWTVKRTDTAAAALRDLRALIDPPIAQALGVTITFTDADGD